MKLPIKRVFFEEIKAGRKSVEFRDAHLTLICEETGEELCIEVDGVSLIPFSRLPIQVRVAGVVEDKNIIQFNLGEVR